MRTERKRTAAVVLPPLLMLVCVCKRYVETILRHVRTHSSLLTHMFPIVVV